MCKCYDLLTTKLKRTMTVTTTQALQNIAGILLLLLSFPMFAEGGAGIIGCLFMIAGGLICIPVTRQLIERKVNLQFSKPLRIIIIALGWLSIGIFSKPASVTKENTANTSLAATPAPGVKPVADTLAAKNTLTETGIGSGGHQQYASGLYTGKERKGTKSYASRTGGYTRGPRGGCYYINASGNKVYVDRSYCN